jgi:hypothetical protein
MNVSKTAPGDFDLVTSAAPGFNQGWRKVDGITFVSERVLDVAGLAMEEETLFFDGITVQEASFTAGISGTPVGTPGDSFIVMDFVSTVPIDIDADFGKIFFHGVGFPASGGSNFEHIPYARTVRYTLDLDTNAAFAFKASTEQSGSMEPTASDRLYVYRLIFIIDFSGTTSIVTVPGARVLFALTTKEEPTYEYLMRLKRSYDLQQSSDVD